VPEKNPKISAEKTILPKSEASQRFRGVSAMNFIPCVYSSFFHIAAEIACGPIDMQLNTGYFDPRDQQL